MSDTKPLFTGTSLILQPAGSGQETAAMIAAESGPSTSGIVRLRIYAGDGVRYKEEQNDDEKFLTLELSEAVFESIQRHGLQRLVEIQHLRTLSKLGLLLSHNETDHD